MDFTPSQTDLHILSQKSRTRYARLKLYDESLVFLGEIQGEISDGSITLDSSSDIRTSCSLTVHVKDDTYNVSIDSKIWLTRILNVEVGEKITTNENIVYYQVGVFAFDNTSYNYSATSKTLSLNCSDLMVFLNNSRGGQLTSLSTQILYEDYGYDYWYYYYITEGYTDEQAAAAATERDAQPLPTLNEIIVDTLNQLSFINGRYNIDNIYDAETGELATVPYDLTFSTGSTIYDVLAKIRDLYPGWEIYFDRYGFFNFRKTPDYNAEGYFITEDILRPLVISESLDRNFDDIHNCTFVWGAQIEADFFVARDAATAVGNSYILIDSGTSSITGGDKFGFVPPANSVQGQTIAFNTAAGEPSLQPYPIKIYINNESLCEIPDGYLLAGESYVAKLVITPREEDRYYYLYGQYQVHGEFEEHNIYATAGLSEDSYILNIPCREFIERQVCEDYESTVGGVTTQYSFVKTEFHLVNGTKLIFQPPTNSVASQRLSVHILKEDGSTELYRDFTLLNGNYQPIALGELRGDAEYVFQIFHGIPILQGVTPASTEVSNLPIIDLSNPFAVEKVGRIANTLSDGDYANIGNDELANQRAEYQTNLSTHFNDQISLSMVLIPWLSVNSKISYTSLNTRETHDYLATSISWSLSSGQMTVSLSRLYNTFI